MSTRETLKAIHDRGELIPWLNGETEALYMDATCQLGPYFSCKPENYTFRAVPKPVLRPWTWEEFMSHVDCWFRWGSGSLAVRVVAVDEKNHTMLFSTFHAHRNPQLIFESMQYLDADGTWKICGELTNA